ncbi:hypothetical protein AB205_0066180 [Aquarana catesbeiana]|uniref:Uncharacterized protein n=1 Tax=Aquarana catesbeiana TaxID=8400 RepID=A0A2G9QN92_AQUCT|nr:hypothetical protein AB205_0066180 [Aquarana catesbeiana]
MADGNISFGADIAALQDRSIMNQEKLAKLQAQVRIGVLDSKAPKPEDIEEEDDDVPELVENFDEASKNEAN